MKKTLVLFVMVALLMAGSHSFAQKHGYVDLGLPSGTLWATCNVGANAPEEYGDYFAWGETSTKTIYNWSTYKYANGARDKLTKYCYAPIFGNNGFTDTLTTLQPTDDAVTVNWGDEWCIPTADQWEELRHNTICVWTNQNGVNGRLFTAKNGNSLFLPAAGYQDDGLDYVGSRGYYWSSSLCDYQADPCCFKFDSDYYSVKDAPRDWGQPVRPVRSAKTNSCSVKGIPYGK